MRLTPPEVAKIVKVLSKVSGNGEIYLHGSRMDDEARGGDIDLFIVVPDDEYSEIFNSKYKIEAELSLMLNEQKIDLIVVNKNGEDSHSFFVNSQKLKLKFTRGLTNDN